MIEQNYPGKPKAYSYIRMSTAAQLKGRSLDRQLEISRGYAEAHGLHLVDSFELADIGVSAFIVFVSERFNPWRIDFVAIESIAVRWPDMSALAHVTDVRRT